LSLRRIRRRLRVRPKVYIEEVEVEGDAYMQDGGRDEKQEDVAMPSQAAEFTYYYPYPSIYVYPRGSSADKSVLSLYSAILLDISMTST
jgi:hypothetical protein